MYLPLLKSRSLISDPTDKVSVAESGSGSHSNDTNEVEVVNSSQLLNMLKSCSGCLVTIKNPLHAPKNESASRSAMQNANTTSNGLYLASKKLR